MSVAWLWVIFFISSHKIHDFQKISVCCFKQKMSRVKWIWDKKKWDVSETCISWIREPIPVSWRKHKGQSCSKFNNRTMTGCQICKMVPLSYPSRKYLPPLWNTMGKNIKIVFLVVNITTVRGATKQMKLIFSVSLTQYRIFWGKLYTNLYSAQYTKDWERYSLLTHQKTMPWNRCSTENHQQSWKIWELLRIQICRVSNLVIDKSNRIWHFI